MTKRSYLIDSISHMDIDSINALLDDQLTYQDLPKYMFIHKLLKAFDTFKKADTDYLNAYPGICNGCDKGCPGTSFVGNNGEQHMDILIKGNDDNITDVYECSGLLLDNKTIKRGERVYIDKFYLGLFKD